MKLFVNRTIINGPYGGGNAWLAAFVRIAKQLGHVIINTRDLHTTPPDVILLAGIDADQTGVSATDALGLRSMWRGRHPIKIVARINECDARKGTNHVDASLVGLSSHFDGTVFVSQWLANYFARSWQCHETNMIHNGVDSLVFRSQDKINNGKLNIVAHHWSDNRMKGADVYESLDRFVGANADKFTFTYIGRHKCDFNHTRVIPPLSGKALGSELGKYDVYVSASRWEPGPNHVIESVSCGIPTYVHVDGGGCVEFAGQDHTYTDAGTFVDLIKNPQNIKQNAFRPATWETCIENYVNYMERLCKTNK